jgi:TatD DNase family protein
MSSIHLIDTHAHLDMKDFDRDRDEVIARALAAGITKIITVGTGIESCRKSIALAEKYPHLYASLGLHPHEADKITFADVQRLRELAKHPKVVAIGEAGLDFYRNYSPREAQFQVFRWQLDLAADLNLPVVIHARNAAKDTVEILSDWVKRCHTPSYQPRGVIHCHTGDLQTAKRYLQLGFYISFAGFVTYPNSQSPQVARGVPIDKILVETDCPFLTPQKHRGTRNEPAYVAITAETLAHAVGIPLEAFARHTTENALRIFKL